MKLRKGFLAAATAAAMMTAGVVAPANAQSVNGGPVAEQPGNTLDDPKNPETPETPETPEKDNGMSSEFKELSPKEKTETIKNYLSIVTAVIGVLSAVFGFAAKYLPMFK